MAKMGGWSGAVGAVVLAISAGTAEAHTGAGNLDGLAAGFTHPLHGLDHLLAMIAAGLLAARIGGRAVWLVPLAVVAMMLTGGMVAMDGWPLPFVETAIALSVLAIAGAAALGAGVGPAVAALLAGGFALFHGHAHGNEMPLDASGLAYVTGFLAASATLIGLGLAFGLISRPVSGTYATRTAAAALAVAGIFVLAGIA